MARRRYSVQEIRAFQHAVARGAKLADVAREHGFATSSFRRWSRKYGMIHIPYEPTDEDREQAAAWRTEPTLEAQWRRYRAFAEDPRWSIESDLPNYDAGPATDGFEWLKLETRPDAQVLVVFEKRAVRNAARDWTDADHPGATHAAAAAIAHVSSLPSDWAVRQLYDHATRMKVPIVFLGDLDPQALHLFAALRAGGRDALWKGRTGKVPVRWIGLDSGWMRLMAECSGGPDTPLRMTIRLGWLDQEYWEFVKRLVPDSKRLLGARGFAFLDSGVKLEADAFLSTTMRAPFVDELRRRLIAAARR